ncbi:MAG: formylglycine-generating enzyme family protein [Opitutales bacterium]|nr:formylglycine-generating enzyme family protein [Opitutales bacterium]
MIRVGANPDFAFAKSPDNKSAGEKSPIDKEYYIAAYPVTNGEYAEFLAENKSVKPPKYWKNGAFPKGKSKHPVLEISYADALKFCDWLSQKDKEFKYRIPTEAEWEYAASGKSRKAYPWGNSAEISVSKSGEIKSKFNYNGVLVSELLSKRPPVKIVYNNKKSQFFGKSELLKDAVSITPSGGAIGWIDHKNRAGFVYTDLFSEISESGGNTTPVDKYPENKSDFGCRDMSGNSWDWTSTVSEAKNGAEKGRLVNAIRGGSWYATARSCSAVFRGEGRDAKGRYKTVGFRLAADKK